jgi:hypothetical protein
VTGDGSGSAFLSLHVGGDGAAECLRYDDGAPILSVRSGDAYVTVQTAGEQVDAGHVDFAYRLLSAVNEYLIECERFVLPAEGGEPAGG